MKGINRQAPNMEEEREVADSIASLCQHNAKKAKDLYIGFTACVKSGVGEISFHIGWSDNSVVQKKRFILQKHVSSHYCLKVL